MTAQTQSGYHLLNDVMKFDTFPSYYLRSLIGRGQKSINFTPRLAGAAVTILRSVDKADPRAMLELADSERLEQCLGQQIQQTMKQCLG